MPAACERLGVECIFVAWDGANGFRVVNLGVNATAPLKPKHVKIVNLFGVVSYKVIRKLSQFFVPNIFFLTKHRLSRNEDRYFISSDYPEIKVHKGDILFCPDAGWNLPIEYLGAIEKTKQDGATIVPLFYDLIPEDYPQFVDARLQLAFSGWLDSMIKFSDGALSISDSVGEQVKKNAKTRGKTIQSVTTYLGADFDTPELASAKVSQHIIRIFSDQLPYIIIGTLEPRKNQKLVFRAFQKLWREGVNVKVCFIGKVLPLFEDIYEEMQTTPQWGHLLTVLQDVNDAELSFCYANAKALIAPSLAEGFDLPIVEALRYSLPVIASDIAVHHEIVKDQVVYFHPNSALALARLIQEFGQGRLIKQINYQPFVWPTWQESITFMTKTISRLEKG